MDFTRASLFVLGLLALSVNALDAVLSSAPNEGKKALEKNDNLPIEMETDHQQTSVDLPLKQGQFSCVRTESDLSD